MNDSFICPECRLVSFNPTDIQYGWCGSCCRGDIERELLAQAQRAQQAALAQQLLTKQQAEGMLHVPEMNEFSFQAVLRLFAEEEWAQLMRQRAQEPGWQLTPSDFAELPLHCYSAFAAVLADGEERQAAWRICLAANEARHEAEVRARREAKARLRKIAIPEPPGAV